MLGIIILGVLVTVNLRAYGLIVDVALFYSLILMLRTLSLIRLTSFWLMVVGTFPNIPLIFLFLFMCAFVTVIFWLIFVRIRDVGILLLMVIYLLKRPTILNGIRELSRTFEDEFGISRSRCLSLFGLEAYITSCRGNRTSSFL